MVFFFCYHYYYIVWLEITLVNGPFFKLSSVIMTEAAGDGPSGRISICTPGGTEVELDIWSHCKVGWVKEELQSKVGGCLACMTLLRGSDILENDLGTRRPWHQFRECSDSGFVLSSLGIFRITTADTKDDSTWDHEYSGTLGPVGLANGCKLTLLVSDCKRKG